MAMNERRPIKRETAEKKINNGNYKLLMNFVSACFEDIYLYYRRKGKDYYVIWYELNYIPGDNAMYHCDLKGFMDEFYLYLRDEFDSPAKEDLEFVEKARQEAYAELSDAMNRMDALFLRRAIEDRDKALESAVMEVIREGV